MNKSYHYLAPFALSILFVAALACGSSGSETEERATIAPARTQPPAPSPKSSDTPAPVKPTDTLEPGQPSPEPQPTNTPTKETVADTVLKEELYFGGAGGSGNPCVGPPESEWPWQVCGRPETETGLPAAWVRGRNRTLCLAGFPQGEIIRVDVYAPNGDYVDSGTFQVEYIANYDATMVEAAMCWPPVSLLGFPTGEWQAVVHSTTGDTTVPFEIEPQERIRTAGVEHDRFSGPFSYRRVFSAGERVVIWGTSFAPNADLILGVYHGVDSFRGATRSVFVYSRAVTTDSQGDFQTSISIEMSDPCGSYWVAVVTDPDAEYYSCDPDIGICRFDSVAKEFVVSCP